MKAKRGSSKLRAMILMAVVLAVISSAPSPAFALIDSPVSGTGTGSDGVASKSSTTTDPADAADPTQDPSCLNVQVLSFAATPAVIPFDGSATLTWSVGVPRGCATELHMLGWTTPLPLQGSAIVQPPYSGTFRYSLRATVGGGVRDLTSVTITVNPLPEPPPGQRQTVVVNGNYPQRLVQAL